jgi:hypothetical protein
MTDTPTPDPGFGLQLDIEVLLDIVEQQDALAAALDRVVDGLGGEEFLAAQWGSGDLPVAIISALAAEFGDDPLTAEEATSALATPASILLPDAADDEEEAGAS